MYREAQYRKALFLFRHAHTQAADCARELEAFSAQHDEHRTRVRQRVRLRNDLCKDRSNRKNKAMKKPSAPNPKVPASATAKPQREDYARSQRSHSLGQYQQFRALRFVRRQMSAGF